MVTRRRPAAEIRRAIVEAAVRVIGERGVDGLTHRAVAEAADVALSSTTYHFASKAMIVAAALQLVVDDDLTRLSEAAAGLSDAVAQGRPVHVGDLVDVLAREIDHGEPVDLRAKYHLHLEAAEHPELRAVVHAWFETVVARTAEVLDMLGSRTPELDARLLAAATDGLRLHVLTTDQQIAAEAGLRPALAHLVALVTDLRH